MTTLCYYTPVIVVDDLGECSGAHPPSPAAFRGGPGLQLMSPAASNADPPPTTGQSNCDYFTLEHITLIVNYLIPCTPVFSEVNKRKGNREKEV